MNYRAKTALILFLSVYQLISCNDSTDTDIKEGERLSKQYCVSCHQYPQPDLLDKNSWGTVMPKMAEFLNVDAYYNPFDKTEEHVDSASKRVAPQEMFPYEKWEKILKYYFSTSPQQPLKRTIELSPISDDIKLFRPQVLSGKFLNPITTLVQAGTQNHEFYFADGKAGLLYTVSPAMKLIDSLQTATGAVILKETDNGLDIVSMGILNPSDKKLGKLTRINKDGTTQVLLDSLNRPVHFNYVDLNNDKKDDIVVCEFGFRHGALSWFENKGTDIYQRHILRALPGATQTEIYDVNKDGLPDIVALMAQGDEGVLIFYNPGNGQFREEKIISFPAVYGSTHFELLDYDHDGYIDILTTNGDNADYSVSLKAYHGISRRRRARSDAAPKANEAAVDGSGTV